MDEKHLILGVHLTDRLREAAAVQQVFTEFGCNIRTRIGLHDVHGDYCSPSGVVLLDLVGREDDCNQMMARLEAIQGVRVQKMVFGH